MTVTVPDHPEFHDQNDEDDDVITERVTMNGYCSAGYHDSCPHVWPYFVGQRLESATWVSRCECGCHMQGRLW